MGRNSKKKKGCGSSSGRKGRTNAGSSDHADQVGEENLIADEQTALSAIFRDDFEVVSGAPELHCIINLRPHSSEADGDIPDILARLVVRCLRGYPNKSPKLQVIPEEGLSNLNADDLLRVLCDQASSNAREGRVVIFDLVDTAKEFLSTVVGSRSNGTAPASVIDEGDGFVHGEMAITSKDSNLTRDVEIYGLFDLFSDFYGGFWNDDAGICSTSDGHGPSYSKRQPIAVEKEKREAGNIVSKNIHVKPKARSRKSKVLPTVLHDEQQESLVQHADKLESVEEETEDESDVQSESSDERMESMGSDSDTGHELFDLFPIFSTYSEQKARALEKELLMIHLLRFVCSIEGVMPQSLSEITSELCAVGVLSDWAKDLVIDQPTLFDKAFRRFCQKSIASEDLHVLSPKSQFWNIAGSNTKSPSSSTSRYLNDFEEIRSLGHGGFGHVVLCKNKLDGRQYAVKKIQLDDKSPTVNEKILREVATLSRLQHQHVVRYYQAWFETAFCQPGDAQKGSVVYSTDYSFSCASTSENVVLPNKKGSTYLYIQMEYCHRTLREYFESYTEHFEKETAWRIFRQIVEGLAHIHGQGIIHRDLNPNNIFFEGAVNDIKIGDFGLAKFLKLDSPDYEPSLPTDVNGASIDGTGQVGTYFYTAPEIEHRWPHINEKADMYSLGVVFFELWHPFDTAMERVVILSDLKKKGEAPSSWASAFPEQFNLLLRLIAASPSDRPSASEVLRDALPPRMEDEWLNDILRTLQTAEDTYVFDRVIDTIFDEERYMTKARNAYAGNDTIRKDKSDYIQITGIEAHDRIACAAKDVFKQHGAKNSETTPLHILHEHQLCNRNALKLLTSGGEMLELCHELRLPFVHWVVANQKLSFKRYEVSWVYRRAVGHSSPYRYLQGDFDIIGSSPALAEAEAIKVSLDIFNKFVLPASCEVRLNHGRLLDAIWSWIGVKGELKQNVAKLLSLMAPKRKSRWDLIRLQLVQDLHLGETIMNRLQTVDKRFCGPADKALARLRGAISPDSLARDALEELSLLLRYLRIWGVESNVIIDALMPPTENYHENLFFQICVNRNPGLSSEAVLLAVGGCYDSLMVQMWSHKSKDKPPGAVGVSLALEKIVHLTSTERKEASTTVLVCSRGGGGLLEERMELVTELWQSNIKAEFVPVPDPSLTVQYEYANDHDIRWLVILTEIGLSHTGSVKVRNLEYKKEIEVERGKLIKFFAEASSTQIRKLMAKGWS